MELWWFLFWFCTLPHLHLLEMSMCFFYSHKKVFLKKMDMLPLILTWKPALCFKSVPIFKSECLVALASCRSGPAQRALLQQGQQSSPWRLQLICTKPGLQPVLNTAADREHVPQPQPPHISLDVSGTWL